MNYNYINEMLNGKIYNSCNHELKVYLNETKYAMTRKGNFFLTDLNAKPDYIIRQMRPLSIRKVTEKEKQQILHAPEVFDTQIDIAWNYDKYDIIVTSNRYAGSCIRQLPTYVDYIDRLFVPIKLFNRNPEKEKAEIIGCVGFQKYVYPKLPGQYMTDLQNGFIPSKAAIQVCINLCNSPNVAKSITDTIWLGKLADYVNLKGVSYEKCINNR